MPWFSEDIHANDAVHVLTDGVGLGEEAWKVELLFGVFFDLLGVPPPSFTHGLNYNFKWRENWFKHTTETRSAELHS